MSDYADILSKSWDEIPETQVLPTGSYLLRARSASYQASKSEEGSPAVLFVYSAKEPMEDVDNEEFEKLGENYDIGANRIFSRFYVNDTADWDNVRKHLAKHGIDTKGQSIEESLKQVKGRDVVAFLGQRTFTTNAGETKTENNPSNFVAVAE